MTSAEVIGLPPEAAIKKITKFFYFTLSNENKIIEASSRAVSLFEKSFNLVQSLNDIWKLYKNDRYADLTTSEMVEPVFGVSLDQWTQFRKTALDEEVFITTLVLLDIDINVIADGLSLPKGTVIYRINRALIKLGNLLENGI
ncbi:MAG TPA: hypothetical protein PLJ21_08255 [Pseudobdellovibrionaceae bacterium]|nr:hypothetical protein [Pseudobdellovibrionaceae bacterium]